MALQNVNNKQATGALGADINDTVTVLDLGSGEGADFPEGPGVVLIDDELIRYQIKAGDTFAGLTRGYGDTTAASHTSGTDVDFKVSAEWFAEVATRLIGDLADVNAEAQADGFTLVYDATAPLYSQVQPTDAMVYDNGTPQTFEEAALTYDGDVGTYWNSGNGGLRAAYDFGEAVEIRKIRMYVSNRAGTLNILRGDTALNWSTGGYTDTGVNIVTEVGEWVEVLIDDGAHRYWQFEGSSQKAINDVEFYTIDSEGSWKATAPGTLAGLLPVEGTVQAGDTDGDLLQWTGDYYELYDEKGDLSVYQFDVPTQSGTLADLIDRSEATEYRGQWGHGGGWMYFDFGAAVTLDRIGHVNGGYATAFISDIEYSDDGSSWTSDSSGLTGGGSTNTEHVVDLAASRTARYFRIYVDGGGQYVPSWKELYFYVSDTRWVPTTPAALFESMGIFTGTGSPESAVTADVGAIYLRTDGGASTTLYVKESGTGNTGWVAK